mmetsp:Transcript_9535/g.18528  ORF Transcript_9535/g.18528 Transcript_9535/m.18528 type:complete len:269 (+) Transcript_9535:7111-7917(+)
MTIWDMEQSCTLREALFPDTVLRILTNNLRVVVVTRKSLYVYNTATMNPSVIPTVDNPKGLSALTPSNAGNYLVFPSSETVGNFKLFDAVTLILQDEIEAHKNPLSAITLAQDGTLAATASIRGTVIRVFSLYTRQKLFTFKRGLGAVELEYLNFSYDKAFLISSSASGTIHLFKLKEERSEAWGASFLGKVFSIAQNVMPETMSESLDAPKSFMQIRTGYEVQAKAVLLANPDRLFVVNLKGVVQVFSLNLIKGESTLVEEHSLLNS